MSRRARHLNIWQDVSDQKFLVPREDNGEVTGVTDFGWYKLEYSEATTMFQVSFYGEADDANPVAQSDQLDASTLPTTVTLNEYGGSGITATIYVDGTRT